MQPTHFLLLYVAQPEASARFYETLLGKPPIEASPPFAMFALEGGLMLGLWARPGVEPAAQAAPGASELAFPVRTPADVDAMHARWQQLGVPIAQAPVRMDFGYTFLGLDPDGHRLRGFAPGEE